MTGNTAPSAFYALDSLWMVSSEMSWVSHVWVVACFWMYAFMLCVECTAKKNDVGLRMYRPCVHMMIWIPPSPPCLVMTRNDVTELTRTQCRRLWFLNLSITNVCVFACTNRMGHESRTYLCWSSVELLSYFWKATLVTLDSDIYMILKSNNTLEHWK